MLFREIVTGIEGVNRTVVDIVVKGHVTSCSGAGQVIEEVAQGNGGIVVDGDAEGAREGVAKEHAEFTIMYVGLRRHLQLSGVSQIKQKFCFFIWLLTKIVLPLQPF